MAAHEQQPPMRLTSPTTNQFCYTADTISPFK
uniref:Uncharacterized protein n=1 Tax=Arundo donax TaxID=35708 RepID=A0A0A9HQS8_ARUDO